MKYKIGAFAIVVLIVAGYYFYPEARLSKDVNISKIIVRKSKRTMEVYDGEKVLKTYTVSLGRNPIGDKQEEGDYKTPEGSYKIISKNDQSGYHKNLGVSYPNSSDTKEAKRKGIRPGGDIKIHGLRNGLGFIGKFQRWYDWTAGCIGLTDQEVDELYDAVDIGTPIIILP